MKRKYLPAVLAAAALIAAGCGDDDEAGTTASKAPGNGTDRAFVADMVPHHQSAVEMATIAQDRGQSQFVKRLADDIIRTQNEEISTLRRVDKTLATAGIEKGSLGVPEHMMGMNDDPQTLKTANPFDRAFLGMMIPHHQGAIEMALVEGVKGSNPTLQALGQDIIRAQQREIREMRKELGDAGTTDGSAEEEGGHGSGHSG
jgi:uncharacterized protein (DUF305 family)